MSGSLTCVSFEVGGGENVPGIPGACATRNFTYLIRGPLTSPWWSEWSHESVRPHTCSIACNALSSSVSISGSSGDFRPWNHTERWCSASREPCKISTRRVKRSSLAMWAKVGFEQSCWKTSIIRLTIGITLRTLMTSAVITDAKSVDSNLVDFDSKTCLHHLGILHNNSS